MTRRDLAIVHARVGHTPCGKQGYSSRKAARKARRTSPDLAGVSGLAAYLCPDCALFHLGHVGRQIVSGERSRAEVYGGDAA